MYTTNPHERSVSNGRASCLASAQRAATERLPSKIVRWPLAERSAIARWALVGISGVTCYMYVQCQFWNYCRKWSLCERRAWQLVSQSPRWICYVDWCWRRITVRLRECFKMSWINTGMHNILFILIWFWTRKFRSKLHTMQIVAGTCTVQEQNYRDNVFSFRIEEEVGRGV